MKFCLHSSHFYFCDRLIIQPTQTCPNVTVVSRAVSANHVIQLHANDQREISGLIGDLGDVVNSSGLTM